MVTVQMRNGRKHHRACPQQCNSIAKLVRCEAQWLPGGPASLDFMEHGHNVRVNLKDKMQHTILDEEKCCIARVDGYDIRNPTWTGQTRECELVNCPSQHADLLTSAKGSM